MSGGVGGAPQSQGQETASPTTMGGMGEALQTLQQAPTQQAQQVSPLNRQMANKQNFQNMGLQALYQGMMSNFAPPEQQAPQMQMPQMQMPVYQQQAQQYNPMPAYGSQGQNNPLAYRPDTTQAQLNLQRTATTQAEARAKEQALLDAENAQNSDDADFQAWQRQQYEAAKNAQNQG